MDDDAPVLRDENLCEREAESFYLVGLIGGKEVGKSALSMRWSARTSPNRPPTAPEPSTSSRTSTRARPAA
jgi:hypothetical protein